MDSESTSHWAYWVRKAVTYANANNYSDDEILDAIWYISDRSEGYNEILENIAYPPNGPIKNWEVDVTPPTPPVVTDDGDTTTDNTKLHATWVSEEYESGIVEYLYAIGTNPGATDVVGWTSAGGVPEVTHTGLHLATGIYYFTVKARNGAGLWSEPGYSDGITVIPALIANAGADVSICSGSCITLSGSSSGGTPPYTYLWTPSTGLSSDTVANSSACPTVTSTYTLTVTDSNGYTDIDMVTVTVYPSVKADFLATPTIGCAPLLVSFTNLSTGGVISYLWSFGDGRTSALKNPTHTYTNPGVYTASLTVSLAGADACGFDSETKVGYIRVDTPTAQADFSAAQTTGCAPLLVSFSDLSTGDVISYLWSFGDGRTSTLKNPTHIYNNPGTYTISLVVADTCGFDTETKQGYIRVGVGVWVSNTSDTTVRSQDGKVEIAIEAGDLGTNAWIIINQKPEDTTGTIPGNYYQLGQTVVELAAYDLDGDTITNFDNPVLLTLYYSDTNPEDGIVDNTNPPIDESTLKIFKLVGGRWDEVLDSEVDTDANKVSANLSRFSVYCLMGQPISLPDKEPTEIRVYPNPCKGCNKITFSGLRQGEKVEIYTIAGELVESITASGRKAEWYLKNEKGKQVSSGIYIYLVNPSKKVGKIAVIR